MQRDFSRAPDVVQGAGKAFLRKWQRMNQIQSGEELWEGVSRLVNSRCKVPDVGMGLE